MKKWLRILAERVPPARPFLVLLAHVLVRVRPDTYFVGDTVRFHFGPGTIPGPGSYVIRINDVSKLGFRASFSSWSRNKYYQTNGVLGFKALASYKPMWTGELKYEVLLGHLKPSTAQEAFR